MLTADQIEALGDKAQQLITPVTEFLIEDIAGRIGLAENSEWAQNEEMVDFFAIQFPKLMEAFKNADAI